MKLKWIMAVIIVGFLGLLIYFFANGYLLYHAPASSSPPSPAAIQSKTKAAKSGLFEPPSPPIIQ